MGKFTRDEINNLVRGLLHFCPIIFFIPFNIIHLIKGVIPLIITIPCNSLMDLPESAIINGHIITIDIFIVIFTSTSYSLHPHAILVE